MRKIRLIVLAVVLATAISMSFCSCGSGLINTKPETTVTETQTNVETPTQTDDNSPIKGFIIGLGAIAVGGIIGFGIIKLKNGREDEDEE